MTEAENSKRIEFGRCTYEMGCGITHWSVAKFTGATQTRVSKGKATHWGPMKLMRGHFQGNWQNMLGNHVQGCCRC